MPSQLKPIPAPIPGQTASQKPQTRERAAGIAAKRDQAENLIKRGADFDRLISQISTAFVASSGMDVDREIQHALASIGAFIAVDRAYVFRCRESSGLAGNTHEWCAEGVDARIDHLKSIDIQTELPWFAEHIRKGETFSVASVADLSPEAVLERKHFEAHRIQSLIAVPMIFQSQLFGFWGFDSVSRPRTWSDEDLALLHFVGGIFVNALERKRWEEELRESRERLELAITGTNAGLWDWHVQTGEVIFNEGWAEMIGYRLHELEPVSIQTWTDHCHPYDLNLSAMELEKHFAGKTDIYNCEVRMRHKNGTWVWIRDRGKVVTWDECGKPLRMVGTHMDITAQKLQDAVTQAERDMAALWSCVGTFRERLEVCLNAAIQVSSMDCGGLYLVNENDGSLALEVCQGLSESFIENSRYFSADSFNARTVEKGDPLFGKFDSIAPERGALLKLEGLKAIAVIPVHFQGRAIACLNLASHSIEILDEQSRKASKQIAAYLGSFIVQEMLEEKNRQARRDLEALFNTIQDMLFILDSKGCIIATNKAAATRLGYDAAELAGRNVLSVHAPDRQQEVLDIVERMIAKELEYCHIPLLTKNGRHIPVETKVIMGHWNDQPAIYGISRDISERIKLEQQGRQIEKTESLSRMAGSIAHNFNNMLGVIIGNLELAMLDPQNGRGVSENLAEAFQAAKKAADLTKRMATYLGQTNAKHEALDLADICNEFLPILSSEIKENVFFEVDFPSNGLIVLGNANQIHQVIKILVLNAAESYDDAGGSIMISITCIESSEIPSKHFPVGFRVLHDAYACLQVKDAGCGIAEKDLENIFDPFFSTKFTGRGMGLAVALGIIREHGGAMSMESAPGHGSAFQVFLPLMKQPAPALR
jgi:PAS domain S-box-containing protein